MSQDNENQEAVEYIDNKGSLLERTPSWLVSMIVHTCVLIVMMFFQVDQAQRKQAMFITSTAD